MRPKGERCREQEGEKRQKKGEKYEMKEVEGEGRDWHTDRETD